MTGLWSTSQAWDPVELLGRQLGELADRETRLLAGGVGEHFPHEVLVNVEQVRTERAQLLGAQRTAVAFAPRCRPNS